MSLFERLFGRRKKIANQQPISRSAEDQNKEGFSGHISNLIVEALSQANAGNLEQSLSIFSDAVSQARNHSELGYICANLSNMALQYLSENHFREAAIYLEMALTTTHQLGLLDKIAMVLNNLGIAYRGLGRYEDANVRFKESLSIARQTGIQNIEAVALSQLALTAADQTLDSSSVLPLMDQAWSLHSLLPSELLQAILFVKVRILLEARRVQEAIQFVIEVAEDSSLDLPSILRSDLYASAAQFLEGERDISTACDIWDKALNILPDHEITPTRRQYIITAAKDHRHCGKKERALELFEKALPLFGPEEITDRISCLITIGNVLMEMHCPDKAVSPYWQAVELLRKRNESEGMATALNNWGLAVVHSKGYDEQAEQALLEAAAIRRGLSLLGHAGDSYLNLSGMYQEKQYKVKELHVLSEARELYKLANLIEKEAECLLRMALAAFEIDLQTARESARESEMLLRMCKREEDLARCLLLEAEIELKDQCYQLSLDYSSEAAELSGHSGNWLVVLQSLLKVAVSLIGLNRIEVAKVIYELISDAAREKTIFNAFQTKGEAYGAVSAKLGLGVCALIQRDLPTAKEYLQAAADAMEERHHNAFNSSLPPEAVRRCADFISDLRSRNFEAETYTCQQSVAGVQDVHLMEPHILDLLTHIPGLSDIGGFTFVDARYFSPVYTIMLEDVLLAQGLNIEAFQTVERSKSRSYSEDIVSRYWADRLPGIAGVGLSPNTPSLAQMMGWIEKFPGTVLVEFFVGHKTGLAWVATSSDERELKQIQIPSLNDNFLNRLLFEKWFEPHRAFDLAVKEKQWHLIKQAEQTIKTSMNDLLRELYELLFSASNKNADSILKLLGTGARRIVLVPHGKLHGIPLHATVDKDGMYLCDKFEVVYGQSVQILNHVLNLERSWGDRILIVSNPDGTLTGTEGELEVICPLFDSPVVLGPGEALAEEVLQIAQQSDVAHFSCHASFVEGRMDRSGLVLSDGTLLSVSDLIPQASSHRLRLYNNHLRCVFLAGCETAVAQNRPYEEVLSLATGFMALGSSTIIASLWKVDNDSTIELVRNFYTNVRKHGMPVGVALHKAQETVRNDSPHPYYWAPFQLIGSWL